MPISPREIDRSWQGSPLYDEDLQVSDSGTAVTGPLYEPPRRVLESSTPLSETIPLKNILC